MQNQESKEPIYIFEIPERVAKNAIAFLQRIKLDGNESEAHAEAKYFLMHPRELKSETKKADT